VGFNFVDAIIVTCVVCVLALLYFVYSPLELLGIGTKGTNIIYTVKIFGVPSEYAAAINTGDTLSDSDGYFLGTVAAEVEIEPYSIYQYKDNEFGSGGIVRITHPDLVNLIITVSAGAFPFTEAVKHPPKTADAMTSAMHLFFILFLSLIQINFMLKILILRIYPTLEKLTQIAALKRLARRIRTVKFVIPIIAAAHEYFIAVMLNKCRKNEHSRRNRIKRRWIAD
jgi:hypothetical protein